MFLLPFKYEDGRITLADRAHCSGQSLEVGGKLSPLGTCDFAIDLVGDFNRGADERKSVSFIRCEPEAHTTRSLALGFPKFLRNLAWLPFADTNSSLWTETHPARILCSCP